ncbi:hypothetical protein GCM10009560_44810 [Nonomuraea longicatena]|uniref:Uncharacterized protein n=1 Tax=Nonomuraea longicatena TaxID=83682 RepID=A0ABP4AG92_9ACTN
MTGRRQIDSDVVDDADEGGELNACLLLLERLTGRSTANGEAHAGLRIESRPAPRDSKPPVHDVETDVTVYRMVETRRERGHHLEPE